MPTDPESTAKRNYRFVSIITIIALIGLSPLLIDPLYQAMKAGNPFPALGVTVLILVGALWYVQTHPGGKRGRPS